MNYQSQTKPVTKAAYGKFLTISSMLVIIVSSMLCACGDTTATPSAANNKTGGNSQSNSAGTLGVVGLNGTQGNNPNPNPNPTIVAGKLGQTIQTGGYTLVVNKFEKVKQYNNYSATPGNVLVGINLTIGSTESFGVASDIRFTRVTDQTGRVYKWAPFGPTPDLPMTSLVKGQSLTGWWDYQVPEAAPGLVFEFTAPTATNVNSKFTIQVPLE